MIRINLHPSRKSAKTTVTKAQKAVPSGGGGGGTSKGQIALVLMILGWSALGGVGWWLIKREKDEATALKTKAGGINKEADDIRKDIREEELQASKDRLEQVTTAVTKLIEQKRTPAFVMKELSNICSTNELPDIDDEAQAKRERDDPEAKLSPTWDGTSVWITSLKQEGSSKLLFEGEARDAADLSEFVKRMRASARFVQVSNARFENKQKGKQDGELSYVSFTMTAYVRYWD